MLPRTMTDLVTSELEVGYLAHRAGAAQPGVVVIHDVWGLSAHYRDLARRLAGDGFAALAVNLYRRTPEPKITDPGAWIRALSDPQVIDDVQSAVDLLAAHASVAGRRIGVVGFCMGGTYTIHAAASCRGVSAAVPFYGMLSHEHGLLAPPPGESLDPACKPRSPLDAARSVRCPLLGCFGAEDPFIPTADVRRFDELLDASGQPHEVIVYPGAGHAFVYDTRAETYRPEAARDAWSKLLAFLRRHLVN
jgi:carboxymethylenebutenolidase